MRNLHANRTGSEKPRRGRYGLAPLIALRIGLGAMTLPFLVGFGYPDSTGTYAGVSAGGGRYRFTPGCSRYTYGVDFREADVSLQHRIALRTPEPGGGILPALKPRHVSLGLNADFLDKRIEVVGWDTSSRGHSETAAAAPPADQPQIGSRADAIGYAIRARMGLDWKWIGATGGLAVLAYSQGEHSHRLGTGDQPAWLPILGLRIGDVDWLYFSWEMLGSAPIVAGGSLVELGLGGKWLGTRLWAGLGGLPYDKSMAILKASRPWGPVDLSLGLAAQAGDFTLSKEYSASLGLGYRIPWH